MARLGAWDRALTRFGLEARPGLKLRAWPGSGLGARLGSEPGSAHLGSENITIPFYPQIKRKGVQIKIRGRFTRYQIQIRGHFNLKSFYFNLSVQRCRCLPAVRSWRRAKIVGNLCEIYHFAPLCLVLIIEEQSSNCISVPNFASLPQSFPK